MPSEQRRAARHWRSRAWHDQTNTKTLGVVTEVNVYQAKNSLSALLAKVEAGEDVVIARNGRPVARLVPIGDRPETRTPGAWWGRVWIADDVDEADDTELSAWCDGPLEPQADAG